MGDKATIVYCVCEYINIGKGSNEKGWKWKGWEALYILNFTKIKKNLWSWLSQKYIIVKVTMLHRKVTMKLFLKCSNFIT